MRRTLHVRVGLIDRTSRGVAAWAGLAPWAGRDLARPQVHDLLAVHIKGLSRQRLREHVCGVLSTGDLVEHHESGPAELAHLVHLTIHVP